MPTTSRRRRFIPEAIRLFLSQTWPETELVVVGDLAALRAVVLASLRCQLPNGHGKPLLRVVEQSADINIGRKRNLACEAATGELIVHWDDDDWYAPGRIDYQVRALLNQPWARVCGEHSLLFYDERDGKAYRYRRARKEYAIGTSLCYYRSYWQEHPFQTVMTQEDNFFVSIARRQGVLLALDPVRDYIVARIHDDCTSPKPGSKLQWWEQPAGALPVEFPREVPCASI